MGESNGYEAMDADLEDYIDCLSGALHDEAKAIVHALNNDRNQAQKARLEARMATTQINQKIHDIAEARWKMLPIAVQREHDILAMDISELQWHVKQEKQELMKAEEKLDYASTINKRLKADIDFNKNHSPLVEEKLRLEQAAMTEIKKEQVHQDEVLLHSRAQLKVEEEKFERRTSKINANKQKYKNELEAKQFEAARMEDKIDETRQKIVEQEAQIADLKAESIDLQKREKQGIINIESLKADIKTVDADTIAAQQEREALRVEKEQRHTEYESRLEQLKKEHRDLVFKLADQTKSRDDLRLENEDSKRRQAQARANIAKLEKENTRLTSERESAEKEHNQLVRKIRKLEKENQDFHATCQKKERQSKQLEDNLQMAVDQTRNEIEEEGKSKNIHEQRLRDDTALLQHQTEVYNTTTRDMEQHIADLTAQLNKAQTEYNELQNEQLVVTAEYEQIAKKLADRTEENRVTCEKLNKVLNGLSSENKEKKAENDTLERKLSSMMKHQSELEMRTRDLICQQKILSEKTVKVDAEIVEVTDQLKLVENDHQIQSDANVTQVARLDETQLIHQRRKAHFETLIDERKDQLNEAREALRNEVELNAELAKRYKVLQAQQLKVKANLSGFYETRVFLEETKVWMDRIITMESKYYDTTKDYFEKRDQVYQSQFKSLHDEAKRHIAHVVGIEQMLTDGSYDMGEFLLDIDQGQREIQKRRFESMTKPVNAATTTADSLPNI